jgi:hypothetical protein
MVEYLIVCPECGTEVNLVVKDKKLVICHCLGCDNKIVMYEGILQAVSSKFLESMIQRFDFKVCGKVLAAKLSAKGSRNYENKKYDHLSELLSEDMDVSDFLKKIP